MEEIYSSQIFYYYLKPNHANTVQIRITFDQDIDLTAMQHAATLAIERYPYFKVKMVKHDESIVLVDNPAPFLIYDDVDAPDLGRKANNNYLLRVSCAGPKLNVCMSHALTDGRGIMNFVKTMLHLYWQEYAHEESGITPVFLPETPVSEEEIIDPLLNYQISGKEAKPENKIPCFRPGTEPDPDLDIYVTSFSVKSDAFMAYSQENDGSPNTMMALLLSRALAELYPEETDNILAGIAGDLKPGLGIHDGHHTVLATYQLPYSKRIAAMDLGMQSVCFRGKLILESDPDNSYTTLDNLKKVSEYLKSRPTMEEKKQLATSVIARGGSRFSFSVSYVGKMYLGKVGEHIQHIDTFVDNTEPLLSVEIMCSEEKFYFTVFTNYRGDDVPALLMKEFEKVGIECTDVLSYVAPLVPFDGIDNLEEV